MSENGTMWAVWALDILQPVLLALIGLAAAYLSKWLRAKTANEQIDGVTRRLVNAAEVAVRATEQTLVAELKRGAADGKLSTSDGKAAAHAALSKLRDLAGPVGIEQADSVLGNADEWARLLIEAEIDKQRVK